MSLPGAPDPEDDLVLPLDSRFQSSRASKYVTKKNSFLMSPSQQSLNETVGMTERDSAVQDYASQSQSHDSFGAAAFLGFAPTRAFHEIEVLAEPTRPPWPSGAFEVAAVGTGALAVGVAVTIPFDSPTPGEILTGGLSFGWCVAAALAAASPPPVPVVEAVVVVGLASLTLASLMASSPRDHALFSLALLFALHPLLRTLRTTVGAFVWPVAWCIAVPFNISEDLVMPARCMLVVTATMAVLLRHRLRDGAMGVTQEVTKVSVGIMTNFAERRRSSFSPTGVWAHDDEGLRAMECKSRGEQPPTPTGATRRLTPNNRGSMRRATISDASVTSARLSESSTTSGAPWYNSPPNSSNNAVRSPARSLKRNSSCSSYKLSGKDSDLEGIAETPYFVAPLPTFPPLQHKAKDSDEEGDFKVTGFAGTIDSSSDLSSVASFSTNTSFVSFHASIAKGAGGMKTFRAESFTGKESTLDDATDSEYEGPMGDVAHPTLASFRKKSQVKKRPEAPRPSHLHRHKTMIMKQGGTPNTVSLIEQCRTQPPKQTLGEARQEVKDLMEIDFGVSTGTTPFEKLETQILLKLVVLFSRLSEEIDAVRCDQFLVACVCEVLKCDRASIFMVEDKTVRSYDENGNEIRVPMTGSLAGYAALNNRVLNIADAYSDPRFNKHVDKETGYHTFNLLVYPISRGATWKGDGEVIAVIEAINKEGCEQGRSFTAEDESILALLGKQAGVHMTNSKIFQQLQNESLKTQTLLEVSKEISDVQLDLGMMMSRIMSHARQVLLVERASIFLIDEEKKELWSILTDSETAEKVGGDNIIRLPVGVGVAGTVAKTGEMLNISDAYSSPLFNPAFDKRTGYVTRSILCVPIRASVHANKVMGVMQFINKVDGTVFKEEDERLANTFSSFVGISLNNLLLYDELKEGQLIRQKNKELVRLRDKAKQAAEAKANFLMSMSHEIRTPMSGVIGMCELLQGTQLSDEQLQMVAIIRNCGEALMAIINDILDYGRLETGKLELEQCDFNLVALLEDTMDVIRSKVEAKDISMVLDIDPELAMHVVGDSYRLRQILTNLLSNAVKFTPNLGEISLRATPNIPLEGVGRTLRLPNDQDDDQTSEYTVYFAVTDTGIGISKNKQQSLFLPFHQASAGTTRQYGGSGLGLSICKQLVEVMRGRIGVHSDVGKGATFWFTVGFPQPQENPLTLQGRLVQGAGNPLPLTVVIAVTSSRLQEVLLQLCGVVGWIKTVAVGDAIELLEVLDKYSGSRLVLLEDSLPGVDSAVISQLHRIGGPVSICVLTTMSKKVTTDLAEMWGESATILVKPPRTQALCDLFQRTAGLQGPCSPIIPQLISEPVEEDKHQGRLLVAEDNPTNQLLITKQLAQFGIVPTMCNNGEAAINKLLEEFHGVVFMDCHMPVLDGYGAVKRIRELEAEGVLGPPKIRVIALTADALPRTRNICLENGMDDYITKPLRKDILKGILEKWYYPYPSVAT